MNADNSVIFNQILILILLMFVGWIAGRTKIMNDEISQGISGVLVDIALPAVIVVSLLSSPAQYLYSKIMGTVLASLVINLSLLFVGRLIFAKYPHDKKAVLNFVTMFPNVAFMGFPILTSFFGHLSIFFASLFMIPYQVLMWTYGQMIFSGEKSTDLKTVVTNPPILATFIGLLLLLLHVKLPYAVNQSLTMLGSLTTPLAMLITGFRISQSRWEDILFDRDIYLGTFVRLAMAPVLTLLICRLIGLSPFITNILVVIEAMPVATSSVVLAEKNRGDVRFASRCSLVGTVFSMITIPIVLLIIR